MVKPGSPAIAATRSASTPAAFTTARASKSPFAVCSRQPPLIFSAPVTAVSKWSSTPFSTAASASASARSHGSTMAALGAYSAPHTASERFGSMASVSSRVSTRTPGTLFATPFSYRRRTVAISSSEKASTRLPIWRYLTSNAAHCSFVSALPRTFSRAMAVPGSGSYPACTMALLARVVPMETSFSFSNTAARSLCCDSK